MAVNFVADPVGAALSAKSVVSLEGYVADAVNGNEIELITDPWMRERLIIDQQHVEFRLDGTGRPNGKSVIWVTRGAPVVLVTTGPVEQFASGGDPNAGGGTDGGWFPPPPWPR